MSLTHPLIKPLRKKKYSTIHKDLKDLDRAECSETKTAALGRGDETLDPSTRVLTVLARISERRCQTFFIREFISTEVCEPRKSNGSGLFAISSHDFEQIFEQILSVRVESLSNTDLVSSRHLKREKGSLPVDVRRSKTSLLKLPNSFNHNESRDDVYKLNISVQEQDRAFFFLKGFVILFFDEVFILITERLAGKVSTVLSF